MKPLRIIALLVFCIGILLSTSACVVILREDRPKHQGWYKNPNNPHHPNSTNPGSTKGNQTEKKHSKERHQD